MTNLAPYASPSTTALTNPTNLGPFRRRDSANALNDLHRFRIGKLNLGSPNRADDMCPVIASSFLQRFPGVLRAAFVSFLCLSTVLMMVASKVDLLLFFFFLLLFVTVLFLFLGTLGL